VFLAYDMQTTVGTCGDGPDLLVVLNAACSLAADKGQLEADLLPPGQIDFAGVSPGLTVNAHA
jgi:hypothetical protein